MWRALSWLAGPLLALMFVQTGAQASPADYPACRDLANTIRALRACAPLRDEVSRCQAARAGGGVDQPAVCLREALDDWAAVLVAEERRLTRGPAPRPDYTEWRAGLARLCRDPEQIRISAERFGAPHANFEAVQCELRRTLRRLQDASSRLKGFR
ncbi:MAG: hypothetical protein AAF074_00745 [Pseudomonadota bacterium]